MEMTAAHGGGGAKNSPKIPDFPKNLRKIPDVPKKKDFSVVSSTTWAAMDSGSGITGGGSGYAALLAHAE
jgi:hypothetical protein